MTKKLIVRVSFLVVLCLMNGSFLASAFDVPCASLLPEDARKEISKSYKAWRILEKEDLNPDDKVLWDQQHEKECPGIAVGKFEDSTETYSVIIIPQQSASRKTKLLLLRKTSIGKYKIKVLYEENNITNYPVVRKEQPREYSDFYEEKHVVIKTEVIVYEHIESSSTAFYYRSGKFRKLLISD